MRDDDELPEDDDDDADRLQRLRRRFDYATHGGVEPSSPSRDRDARERFEPESPGRRSAQLSPKARRGRMLLAAMAFDLYCGDTRLSTARKVMQMPESKPRPKKSTPALGSVKEKMVVVVPGQPPQPVEVKPLSTVPASSTAPSESPVDTEADRVREERIGALREKLAKANAEPKKPKPGPRARPALLAHKITAAIKSRSTDKTSN